jgi:hypothetical protein
VVPGPAHEAPGDLEEYRDSQIYGRRTAQSTKAGKTLKTVAELQRKISQSPQIIAAYERQTRRPRTTDQQTLASVSWNSWNAQAAHTRGNNSR